MGCGTGDDATAVDPLAAADGGSARHADASAALGTNKDGGTSRLIGHASADDDSGVSRDTCESLNITAQPNAPEVLIVLDRSGSMIGNNPSKTNRWNPSSSVIKKVTAELDQVMQFGLMMFPNPVAADVCAVGQVNVPVALGNGATIGRVIDMSQPTKSSATPTAATLQAALGSIGKRDSACADNCLSAQKYVLLVTDGAPNCGADMFNTTQADVDACDTALDALKAAEVTTYVIGYDTAKDSSVAKIMDGFAAHGGTGKQLPVEDEVSLLATLTKIAAKLVPCDYKLSSPVSDPKFIRVTIDDQQYDLGTDWTLGADDQTITLGSACETLRDAKAHNLRITLECEQVIAI